MELRVVSTAKLPLMPSERSVTTTLMLVELSHSEQAGRSGLTQCHRVCDVRVEGSSFVRTVIPPAFVHGLSTRRYPVQLDLRDEGGWRYSADLGMEAIGFDPTQTGGELPEQGSEVGVQDTDEDGRPGATVELRVPAFGRVRLFIAQRSHLILRGVQVGPDRIEGDVDIRLLEQRTLGAEPGFFNRTPTIRPDSARSGFTLIRVPAGVDCTAVRKVAGTLFQRRAASPD